MLDLDNVRNRLVSRHELLAAKVALMEAERSVPHDDDLAEQAIEREADESLDAIERATMDEMESIRQSLVRIDAGRYGICVRCGNSIAPARLEALPTATRCIDCAEHTMG